MHILVFSCIIWTRSQDFPLPGSSNNLLHTANIILLRLVHMSYDHTRHIFNPDFAINTTNSAEYYLSWTGENPVREVVGV